MPSSDAHVNLILSAAVARCCSSAARGPASCSTVCAGRSVRGATGYAGLLAFGGNGNARGQIPLRRDDGRGRAGSCGECDERCGTAFAWPQLGERFLADLQTRTRRASRLLELHDVRKVRKNLRRLERGGGVDQCLARMIGVHGISEDALARMEGVGAFRW